MDTQAVNPQSPLHEALSNPPLAMAVAGGLDNRPLPAAAFDTRPTAPACPHAVTVATAIANNVTREHIERLLSQCEAEIKAKTSAEMTRIFVWGDQANILAWLQGFFLEPSGMPLILICDALKPPSDPVEGFLTRECQKRFFNHALGTIAILPARQRVIDIDRTIAPDVARDDLVYAMVMLLGRIEYLMPPAKPHRSVQQRIVVRPLRGGNEAEFRSYFHLRHRVYSQMGYLPQFAEESVSKLEMDEADVHSIHLGAFCRSGCREELVGTARVVMNSEADPALVNLLGTIARQDSACRDRLGKAYTCGLPISQTFAQMNPIIRQIVGKTCGELSRVIVDRDYRGTGISSLLISEALKMAVGRGLTRIFLECMKIHRPLYEKHGFSWMPGFEASVVDVKRTMIAMELAPEIVAGIAQNLG